MGSVKVKFRRSAVENREGSIYYQIIHEKTPRQLTTDYHVYPYEWDQKRGNVIVSAKSERIAYINVTKLR